MAKYDTTEAVEMLGTYVEDEVPDAAARTAASHELLDELAALTVPGVKVTRKNDVVLVEIGRGQVYAKVALDGTIVVSARFGRSPEDEVPLAYDPVAKKLRGTSIDTRRAPIPGHRQPHRDALAVVVEAVLSKMPSN